MNDGLLIEIVHGSHDPILEFLFGRGADVAEDGAGKFREEALDEVEPGAVLGSEGEFKAVRGLIGEPGFGLFGDVRGMIVEDQLDRCVTRASAALVLSQIKVAYPAGLKVSTARRKFGHGKGGAT